MGHYFGWGGMWLFPIIGIAVLFVVVHLILRRKRFRSTCCGPWHDYNMNDTNNKNPESALDILNKRYASGELSKEEFELMKQNILS